MNRTIEHCFIFPLIAVGLAAALLLAGCGGTGEFPPATEIRSVVVEPNPVAAGDTAVFTCIIKDRSEPGLVFEWDQFEPTSKLPLAVTDSNQYRWKAPSDTGTFDLKVTVRKPEDDVRSVERRFKVTVSENN